ncbi:MAG: HAMP domain-containing sensor histidine kinase [Flavisolibacter sp.]
MFRPLFNWRTLLAILAIGIVSGTISYSGFLEKKIEKEERLKVDEWVIASTSLADGTSKGDTRLHLKIIQNNNDIPIIVTDENDRFIDSIHLNNPPRRNDKEYIKNKILEFKKQNKPVIWIDPLDSTHINRYYYGHTPLLNEVRYYPIIQLLIVGLFIIITLMALTTSNRSTQNHLWAGMAKETAHQLGTPVSSLEGWIEILKESGQKESFISEIEKDVSRLRLVSDRFGKIGSTPQLESKNVVVQIENMVDYIRKRAGGKVSFTILTQEKNSVLVNISAPLFDWVIENLLKNALDALEGKGNITILIQDHEDNLSIDISDTGKGISQRNLSKVFKPGYTTKKRGWGLGLSLSKRIIEQYHKGRLFVKVSEPGKGTTFRIILTKKK